jgi:outer membrane protein assembly factor BamB
MRFLMLIALTPLIALADWPQWRGPSFNGTAPAGDPPTQWSADKNIKWKIKLPGSMGAGSPIVHGDTIFILAAVNTGKAAAAFVPVDPQIAAQPQPGGGGRQGGGAGGGRRPGGGGFGRGQAPTTLHQFNIMAINRASGEIKWQKTLREEVPHEGHHRDHGFASYSCVTDGQHVYAFFGSRGLHCLDMAGNIKWQKDLGKMQTKNGFGEGTTPALHGDTLVVNWDHEGADFIVAFNKTTGDELWRTPRDEDTTWATPLIVEHNGQTHVIVSATKKIRSYDLKTGKQIWEAGGMTANVIPTAVHADGVVYIMSGFRGNALLAIKLGKTGDLTGTDAIAWSYNKNTPYVPSPCLSGNRLYFFAGNEGRLTCIDIKTGKPLYERQTVDDLQGVYASPVAAAGRVYLVGRNGVTVVIKDADKYEEIATNTLPEGIDASPATVGKEMIIRSRENLYCIAEK